MNRRTSLIVLLMLLVSTPAMAGIGEGNGEIGFDFGFTNFDSNTSDETGGRFVFRAGYHFTELFQLEGEIAASVAEEDTFFGSVDTTLTTIFVNAVFNFHPEKDTIVPFVLVGLGSAELEFDTPFGPIDDNATAFQIAGGSRFFFGSNKKVAFRVELSFIQEDTFNDDSSHTSLTGGFTWRLGEAP